MICCNTRQLTEPIASSPQAAVTRTGESDSMEAIDSSRLVEGKDIITLVENGKFSIWQFQRQPPNTQFHDVGLLDDLNARWRMVGGDLP